MKLSQYHSVSITKTLGKGGYGHVYEGLSKTADGQEVKTAIKRIIYRDIIGLDELGKVFLNKKAVAEKEIDIYEKIKKHGGHKNILYYYDFLKNDDSYWIVLQFCELGNLENYMQEYLPGLTKKTDIMKECAEGVHFLHCEMNPPVCHGDIKPANILVGLENKQIVIKLCDFSGSGNIGTVDFLPPEAYQKYNASSECYSSLAGDIYSLGQVFQVILLFKKINQSLVSKHVSSHVVKSIKSAAADRDYIELFDDPNAENQYTLQALKTMINQMVLANADGRLDITNVLSTLISFSNVKEMMCQLKMSMQNHSILKPIPGEIFEIDMMGDVDKLLKLKGICIVPKSSVNKQHDKSQTDQYKINDADILFNPEEARVTLIQGNPGSGKSIFLKRWLTNWLMQTSNCDQQEGVVLLMPMRDIRSLTLIDIIFEDLKLMPCKYKPFWERYLKDEEFSSKITFMIDGADEKMISEQSDVMKIIKGELFPQSKVVITIRNYQNIIDKFQPYADVTFVFTGLNIQSRDKFIRHMLGDLHADLITEFLTQCKNYLFQEDILSVPIYLTLLCIMVKDHYKKNDGDKSPITIAFPQTRYRLYDAFAEIFRDNYMKYSRLKSNKTEKAIQQDVSRLYFLIGRMSFLGLCKGQYIFCLDDPELSWYIDKAKIQQIGFFVEDKSTKNTYSFFHKTFQEYFAGKYCASEGFLLTVPYVLFSSNESHRNRIICDGIENVASQKCLEKRKRKPSGLNYRTLQDTLFPLGFAMQFAVGASLKFAKDLFLFGCSACSVVETEDFYDTIYESSLVYECHKPAAITYYIEFLLSAKRVFVCHSNPIIPNMYNKAVYQYIANKIMKKDKRQIIKSLYGLGANIFQTGEEEEVLMANDSVKSKAADMLLSCLQSKQLPTVITLKAAEVDVEVLTSCLSQIRKLVKLSLINADLSTVSEVLWTDFLQVLGKIVNFADLQLPFCNLQSHQIEQLLLFLIETPTVEMVDISGNSFQNLDDAVQNLMSKDMHLDSKELAIHQNCLRNCTLKCKIHPGKLKLDYIYVGSLQGLLQGQATLVNISITESLLEDMENETLWKQVLMKLQNIETIQQLTLSGCHLDKDEFLINLSETVAKMPQLEQFDVSQNNIGNIKDDSLKVFARNISKCCQLYHLNISKCSFERSSQIEILSTIFPQQLACFYIHGNNFCNINEQNWQNFVHQLKHVQQLEELDFSDCHLDIHENILTLCNAVSKMASLKKLNLSNLSSKVNWIVCFEGIKNNVKLESLHLGTSNGSMEIPLAASVAKITNGLYQLKCLNLCGQNFSRNDKDWENLCLNLGKCLSLKELKLVSCNISEDIQIKHLGNALMNLHQLSILDISSNYIDAVEENTWIHFINSLSNTRVSEFVLVKCFSKVKGISNPLCAALPENMPHLVHLELPHNKLGIAEVRYYDDFITSLKNCEHLNYLKLSKNNLKSPHLLSLSQVVGLLKNLEHFNLDRNNFYECEEKVWNDFTMNLSKCQKLKKLKLSQCGLSLDYHLSCLGDMLCRMPRLEHLDISQNKLSNVEECAWRKFTDGLKHCRLLDKLNLQNCNLLRQYQFMCISEIFPLLSYLRRLNMNGNSFRKVDTDEWGGFLGALQCCKRLEKLHLEGTGLSKNYYWEKISPILVSFPRLFHLSLSRNDISKVSQMTFKHILSQLKRCNRLQSLSLPSRRKRGDSSCKWEQNNSSNLHEFVDETASKL